MIGGSDVVVIHSAKEFRSHCRVVGPSLVNGFMTWVVVGGEKMLVKQKSLVCEDLFTMIVEQTADYEKIGLLVSPDGLYILLI